MTQIPSITAAVAGSSVAQRVQADDKAAQLRQAQFKRNNTPSTTGGDSFEQQVQSPDELEPIADEHHKQHPRQPRQQPRRRKPGSDDDNRQSLDITA